MAEVVEDLVPEPGVEEMQYGVLGAADIQVDAAWLGIARHPVFVGLFADKALGICGIAETQVIPAGAGPLRHGVGLTLCGVRVFQPLESLAEWWLWRASGFEILHVRLDDGKFVLGQCAMASAFPHDGEWLAPVALAGEKPVAKFVVHRAAAEGLLLQPNSDLLLGLGCRQAFEKSRVHSHSLACKAGGGFIC